MGIMRIGGAAINQTPIDWENNVANILEAIQEAKNANVEILCLPELCITGYGCEDLFLTDWVSETALEYCFKIAVECTDIVVALGLPIRLNGNTYNCACLIDNGVVQGFTAKQFLANEGVHYETRWFTAWMRNHITTFKYNTITYPIGDVLYNVKGARIGFEICEDAWRVDRVGIRNYEKGATLILNPSASHFAFGKSAIRYDLVIGGSERFNCTYIYANLLGNEAGRMIYDGEVLIAHKGKLVQRNDRLSFKNVNLIYADIDIDSNEVSEIALTHDDLEKEFEFWEATSLGLFDYMRKSRSKGFVLSLSGGADSAACAIMVAEMIRKGLAELGLDAFLKKSGMENAFDLAPLHLISFEEQAKKITSVFLTTAYQSTSNSGEETFTSAKSLADSIGATFYNWSVNDEIESYKSTIESVIGRELSWETDDLALQNIQARGRAPIIWLLTNIKQALLITTSNRSEGDVGYATMDGDTAGGIAPIAGVDKNFIRNWLRWAEKNRKHNGLALVNGLAPTAELRPTEYTQTDERDLMPYEVLARIERKAIKERLSPIEVYSELIKDTLHTKNEYKFWVTKFYKLWSINQWKRERIAPSFHMDDFNIDPRSWYRFPILSGGFKKELNDLNQLT
ncbi:NAD(+) synthase [uncultured Cytophaga sp.]|uniref:NAD(+) synthase n=1 Tax=uncultured Cytophaga sp. TaxID=160238 RepID=UPI002635F751|nr:NAD(+) synthase [uncultured Cytophaga sp.]